MAAVSGLTDVVHGELPMAVLTNAADYLALVGTYSAYLVLGPAARAAALDQVRAVLPDRFALDATVRLSMARRA
jgi:hypothetical protein